jgi:hypothetical protein
MSSGKGWFESDEAYRHRMEQEANEAIVQKSTGSEPSKGWFESDQAYSARIAKEAQEHTIKESSGSTPSKSWLESDEAYARRIEQEANESVVRESTGKKPSKRLFESEENYNTRIRKEANEHFIADHEPTAPRKGLFETDFQFRSRINQEANESRVRHKSPRPNDGRSNRQRENKENWHSSRIRGSFKYNRNTLSDKIGTLIFVNLIVSYLLCSYEIMGYTFMFGMKSFSQFAIFLLCIPGMFVIVFFITIYSIILFTFFKENAPLPHMENLPLLFRGLIY